MRQPTKQELAAISHIWQGYQALLKLGWQDAMYAPRDGEIFECIELGSTGIHRATKLEGMVDGVWIDGDYPSHPVAIRRLNRK